MSKMENWPKILQDFLIAQGHAGAWTETNPPWDKVRWAWAVSENFLRDPARRGSNWIWIRERSVTPQAETEKVLTSWAVVDVYCYTCATSSNDKSVEDARARGFNMRKIISHLVSINKAAFSPAWVGRPAEGGRPMELETDPRAFVLILPVKFQYEED